MSTARNTAAIAVLAGLIVLGIVGMARGAPGKRPLVGPKKGPGGIRTWGKPTPGTPTPSEPEINPAGPGLWVSPDCDVVAEGAKFWPAGAPLSRNPDMEGTETGKKFDPEVAAGRACRVLDVRGLATTTDLDCTGLDYVDTQIVEQGITDPIQIAREILQQVAPLCADADPGLWSDAVYSWYNDLVGRLVDYIERKTAWLES